jgi:ADP-ribose pyrophosphatase YjhB (NUDIX family)
MKLGSIPTDGRLHTYCLQCRREMVREFKQSGRTAYSCSGCGFAYPRALIIDPAITWWLGQDGEYWHETAGMFVRNAQDQFLFLDRAKHPFGLTIPAGHRDRREAPAKTAGRELFEETGLRLRERSLRLVTAEDILGDECRRGSDAHRWSVFAARIRTDATVKVNTDESLHAVWLHLEEALRANLTFAVRSILTRHAQEILRATER